MSLVLTPTPAAADATSRTRPHKGFAYYDKDKQTLQCVSANIDSVAEALEVAVGQPVINESKLTGRISERVDTRSQKPLCRQTICS